MVTICQHVKLRSMCKEVVLPNMSWLILNGKKLELEAWFENPEHNYQHPNFTANNRMHAEICTEIYKRNLQIELHEC